jgi:hypothetical protein
LQGLQRRAQEKFEQARNTEINASIAAIKFQGH